jgi:hypothetical protein
MHDRVEDIAANLSERLKAIRQIQILAIKDWRGICRYHLMPASAKAVCTSVCTPLTQGASHNPFKRQYPRRSRGFAARALRDSNSRPSVP